MKILKLELYSHSHTCKEKYTHNSVRDRRKKEFEIVWIGLKDGPDSHGKRKKSSRGQDHEVSLSFSIIRSKYRPIRYPDIVR